MHQPYFLSCVGGGEQGKALKRGWEWFCFACGYVQKPPMLWRALQSCRLGTAVPLPGGHPVSSQATQDTTLECFVLRCLVSTIIQYWMWTHTTWSYTFKWKNRVMVLAYSGLGDVVEYTHCWVLFTNHNYRVSHHWSCSHALIVVPNRPTMVVVFQCIIGSLRPSTIISFIAFTLSLCVNSGYWEMSSTTAAVLRSSGASRGMHWQHSRLHSSKRRHMQRTCSEPRVVSYSAKRSSSSYNYSLAGRMYFHWQRWAEIRRWDI